MPEICQPCTEELNDNYTIRTGDLYLCGADGITRSLGNVQSLDFIYAPNSVEHRSGKDGSVDAIIPLSEDFSIAAVLDELTPQNLSYLLGQDMVSSVDGCTIPLDAAQCAREFAAQFVHTFPCSTRTLTINIWRAIISPSEETTISFSEEILSFPIRIRAKACSSIHPGEKFGNLVFNEVCPVS